MEVYGLTKAHGEQYVHYLAGTRGFPAVVVRLFNVVGPGETNPHVVPQIIAQLRAARTRLRLGSTTPRRDFIHVTDAASGFVATALRGNVRPREVVTVNLGTGITHSVAEVVDLLADVTSRTITVESEPARLRRYDNPFVAADVSKMRAAFGWTARFDLPTALRETWRDPDLPAYLEGGDP